MRHPILLACCLIILTATACDDPPAPKLFGASLAAGGSGVELQYVTCPRKAPGKEIEAVRVVERRGVDPWDGDDPVLWEVGAKAEGGVVERSSAFSDVETYRVGGKEAGFEEVVPLRAPLPPETELVAQIETSFSDVGLGFRVRELSNDLVKSADSDVLLTPEDFERQAADAVCRPLRPIVPLPLLYSIVAAVALALVVWFQRKAKLQTRSN